VLHITITALQHRKKTDRAKNSAKAAVVAAAVQNENFIPLRLTVCNVWLVMAARGFLAWI